MFRITPFPLDVLGLKSAPGYLLKYKPVKTVLATERVDSPQASQCLAAV